MCPACITTALLTAVVATSTGGLTARNMYGKGGDVEANGRYHASNCGCTAHKS